MKYVKYPRTYHLPWSKGISSDDKIVKDLSSFQNMQVVVTLKMDGENTSIYNDKVHARSLDSKSHESRDWVKKIQSQIGYHLSENLRICGENLFAKHQIAYDDLKSYFLVFSIWEDSRCLSWEETKTMANNLGLETVEEIYRGPFNQKAIEQAFEPYANRHEGYVVRNVESFNYDDFKSNVAKYVRKGHVGEEVEHWFLKTIVANKLRKE